MNRFLVLFVLLPALQAQEKPADSLSTVSFPEIVVTATRSDLSLADSPSPVEVLRPSDAIPMLTNTADELLGRANGLFLQELGGGGALKTASLRGTAAQHLLVLVNGNRLTSFQNGLVDLSLLPLTDIDRIEVLRGGSSALYGADALGGVVNILTRSAGPGLHARGEMNAGSFGFRRWMMEGDARLGRVGLLAGLAAEEGRDDYPFPVPGKPDSMENRENSDFRRTQAYVHGDVTVGQDAVLSFLGQAVSSENGVPGPVNYPSPQARQKDDDATLQVGLRSGIIQGVDLQVQSAFHYGLQDYSDPNPYFPIKTFYHNSSLSVNPLIRVALLEGLRLTGGAELGEARLRGGDFSALIRRIQQSIYICGEYQWDSERPWGDRLSVFGMMRYDNFSDVDRVVTPKLGVNVRVLKEGDIRVRGSIGRSFRAPSFNDLYYVGFNNPSLKPERSVNVDVGVMSSWYLYGRHSLEFTWYSLRINDRIIFDLNTFRPENIGRSSSTGVEARYTGALLDGVLTLGANYTYTDARKLNRDSDTDPTYNKQLPFIPANNLNFSLTVALDPVSVSLFHVITGRRATNNDNTNFLPAYRFTDVGLSVPITLGDLNLRLAATVDNVFDRRFSIIEWYPMPGRRLSAGIRLVY